MSTNAAMPKQVRAIVQNATAIFPKASRPRLNRTRRIAARVPIAMSTTARERTMAQLPGFSANC